MYASGLGAQVSPLNPYLIEHYRKLKGEDLKKALDSIESNISNNEVVISSLKKSADETTDEEKKEVLLDTIEDLEYQNETNKEILKLLNSLAIKEFRDGK